MNAPLYNQLMAYSQKKYPFHMPGHKFGKFANMKELNLFLLDATEANGLDNLYEAEEVIEEAMKHMANFYKAKETIFLTNGSTAGILTSILAICKPGDKLLVARNCHHSVWSALILSGVLPIYIHPIYREDGIIGEITKESIEGAIIEYPEAKGAILVSPTYEGIVSDISAIANELHKQDKILIVDEAHGAHFVVDSIFPKSSIEEGADLIIHSMHKTLPTLTQSALLHINSDRVMKEEIISALKMVQTSSPSYIMMGIMDYMRACLEEYIIDIKREYIEPLLEVREALKSMRYLTLLDESAKTYDKSKIIVLTDGANINGYELANLLEVQYHIGVEAAREELIILMSTMADDKESLYQLKEALLEIDRSLVEGRQKIKPYRYITYQSALGKSPRDVYFSKTVWMDIGKCIGKVCSKNIMLYPPGIPIVCIGESIQNHHIEIINEVKNNILGIKKQEDTICLNVEDNLEGREIKSIKNGYTP